jgi:hypothetical protein
MRISLHLCGLTLAALVWSGAALAVDMPPDEGGDEEIGSVDKLPGRPDRNIPKDSAPIPPPPPIGEGEHPNEYDTVILQALDKVTGRTSKFSAIVGKPAGFGKLEIIAHRCWQANPEDRPENAALLEIRETKSEETPVVVFMGWMFSSSPGLSGLEHPVYDMTVLSCAAQPKPKAPEPKAEAPKEQAKPKAPERK